jgi:DNA modification methylase
LGASHPDKHREIGSESTPDEYLATMVAVFREVRRVLRPDGTCWVNMGDSYATQPAGNKDMANRRPFDGGAYRSNIGMNTTKHAKPKDLLMMPARLALALQADGWWVRSDIIIAKRNPMPESCRDRPTSAHEHVFLLTKSAHYFFDSDAVREGVTGAAHARGMPPKTAEAGSGIKANDSFRAATMQVVTSRNIRNVWDISTEAFSGAHFATMPTSVVERAIRAGTSERGCCSQCGKPWVRVTERETTTTGWRAGCDHGAPVVPCTVLDPFAGAGTTLLVADRLQRDAIGIELNTAYTEMAMERCRDDAPLFADLPPAADPEDARMADLFAEAAE